MNTLFKKIMNYLPYMAGAIALVCGVGVYVYIDYARLDSRTYLPMLQASQNWPATKGRVVSHSIVENVSGRFSHSPNTHFFAEPEYTYVVNGETFHGVRACFYHSNCNTGTTRDDAQALLDAFPVSSEVDVHYNPEDPSVAVLRPGNKETIAQMKREIFEEWQMAALLLVLGILCVVIVKKTAPEFKTKKDEADTK